MKKEVRRNHLQSFKQLPLLDFLSKFKWVQRSYYTFWCFYLLNLIPKN